MASPDDITKFNASQFYVPNELWPFIEGSSSSSSSRFLDMEESDNVNKNCISPFSFNLQENICGSDEARVGNLLLESPHKHRADRNSNVPVQEKSIQAVADHDKVTMNPSVLLHEQENSVLMDPSVQIQADPIKYCDNEDYLSKFFEVSDCLRPTDDRQEERVLKQESTSGGFDSSSNLFLDEQETSQTLAVDGNDEGSSRNGDDGNKMKGKNPRSASKREEHNTKEKERRTKLNESFLALKKLLPCSKKLKKRSSIPVMIDRAVEYIPELQKEVNKLADKKNELTSSAVGGSRQNPSENTRPSSLHQVPTISVNEVVKGEVVVKTICTVKDQETVFSTLLQNAEAEGMCVISGSTLQVSKDCVCYHLHVQMASSSLAVDDYIAILREKRPQPISTKRFCCGGKEETFYHSNLYHGQYPW